MLFWTYIIIVQTLLSYKTKTVLRWRFCIMQLTFSSRGQGKPTSGETIRTTITKEANRM